MKRALGILFALTACDDFETLGDEARCRADASACDGGAAGGSAGGSAGGAAGGSAGGAAGGSAGGAAGGSAGGGAGGGTVDGGTDGGTDAGRPEPIVARWARGGIGARAIANGGTHALFFADRFDGTMSHARLRLSPDGGIESSSGGTGLVVGAHALGGRVIECTNSATPMNSAPSTITWLNPATLADEPVQQATGDFLMTACNLFPSDAGGGPRIAGWGTTDGGTVLVAMGGVYSSPGSTGVWGTCDGGITPHRIRYSPAFDRGFLTGSYTGECNLTVEGNLMYSPPSQPRGFVVRVSESFPAPSTFISAHRTVSDAFGANHFVGWRGTNSLAIGRLSGNNNPVGDLIGIDMTPPNPLREANEVVAWDGGLLMVGAMRVDGGERDLSIIKITPDFMRGNELNLLVPGDQEVVAATWLDEARLLAVAGLCRNSPVETPYCTGDAGASVSSFVIFIDPTGF